MPPLSNATAEANDQSKFKMGNRGEVSDCVRVVFILIPTLASFAALARAVILSLIQIQMPGAEFRLPAAGLEPALS